jgi:hypothetical protein
MVKNPHLTPDENDTNLYCNVCDKTYKKKNQYRWHLKANSLSLLFGENLSIQMWIHCIPTFFCHSCEKCSVDKSCFRQHLKDIHDIMFPKDGIVHPKLRLISMILMVTAVHVKGSSPRKAIVRNLSRSIRWLCHQTAPLENGLFITM